MKEVLVVAAHPDDEILGCGGTIARHVACGDRVHVLIVGEGSTSRQDVRCPSDAEMELAGLKLSAERAAAVLGVGSVQMLSLPDNRLDGMDILDVVKAVERIVVDVVPAIIYTHHGFDLNVDHRIVHEAVCTACRPLPGVPECTMLFFETASSTEWHLGGQAGAFDPTWFVDITEHIEAKTRALQVYAAELRPAPHPRALESVIALSAVRGSTVGVSHAEAFVHGRTVIREG